MEMLVFLVPMILIFALIALIAVITTLSNREAVFDERQKAARGLAHRDGFYAVVIAFLLYVAFLLWCDPSKQLSVNLGMTALFCGIYVYFISCILRGAYLPINRNPQKSVVGWIVIAAMYLVLLFTNPRDFFQKGIESETWVQFLATVEFVLIAVLTLVRMWLDKKENEE